MAASSKTSPSYRGAENQIVKLKLQSVVVLSNIKDNKLKSR